MAVVSQFMGVFTPQLTALRAHSARSRSVSAAQRSGNTAKVLAC